MKLTICFENVRLGLLFHSAFLKKHQPYVGHLKRILPNHLLACWVKQNELSAGWNMQAGWNPGGKRISEIHHCCRRTLLHCHLMTGLQ